MIINYPYTQNALRDAITNAYRMDEATHVHSLLKMAHLSQDVRLKIHTTASKLTLETRKNRKSKGGLDAFLQEYDLSSDEGIALMCLAEGLLRIPDSETMNRLIGDKIATADWGQHLSTSQSLFVNAATWSLMLTGKIFAPTLNNQKKLSATLSRFMSRTGGTLIRPIILQGMKIIGNQFVMGATIEDALERAKILEKKGYRYSYDMLGEAARTQEDADQYFKDYMQAINAVGAASQGQGPIRGPGISVKLSALHPRYEFAKRERVLKELIPRVIELAKAASTQNIGMCIDAEEADRLELSLDIIEAVFRDSSISGYEGFGLAVQSYQKRAPFVIDWLFDLAKSQKRRFMLRLIKGAYWDYEIKMSQILGLMGYPVFTRKNSTDVSFIACAKKILNQPEWVYPQFGTHNAYSVATILELVPKNQLFEFQCLHGMGEPLYDQIVEKGIPCRIYAPVGGHKDLLAYLVRRLLENGANTSFINRIADDNIPLEQILIDPVDRIDRLPSKPHPHIPLPRALFEPERLNSKGLDLTNIDTVLQLKKEMDQWDQKQWKAGAIINGQLVTHDVINKVVSPANTNHVVGLVSSARVEDVDSALAYAYKACNTWGNLDVKERAAILEKAADLFEKEIPRFMTLLTREGGKQIADCLSEVRETIDYCRYYAARARHDFVPQVLRGPTGEYNQLSLHPRGVFVCISPWNFPLAIFSGQILAALVSGNTVIAKPAEQTPLVAYEAVRLLHEAGVPKDALHLVIGRGRVIGPKLTEDPRVAGIMFTGSTETAKSINQVLAKREGAIIPFIAETGGQNAMIVDSTALPEQVVADVLTSAFNSAGQRCSALRVLFVQNDIADSLIKMLKNAMLEWQIGDPSLISTDSGPVIDEDACTMLQEHFKKMESEGRLIYQIPRPSTLNPGHYFMPALFELKDLSILKREVFGPILHVIRFEAKNLDHVIRSIAHTGYGLTCGIHSRIDNTVNYISERLPVGNTYVNRNMIGAVVGVQPFGGEHLSGTGPKAGGPHYIPRLCVERSISINTTASGGNATLLSLNED